MTAYNVGNIFFYLPIFSEFLTFCIVTNICPLWFLEILAELFCTWWICINTTWLCE